MSDHETDAARMLPESPLRNAAWNAVRDHTNALASGGHVTNREDTDFVTACRVLAPEFLFLHAALPESQAGRERAEKALDDLRALADECGRMNRDNCNDDPHWLSIFELVGAAQSDWREGGADD